jgi:hypothetical protein
MSVQEYPYHPRSRVLFCRTQHNPYTSTLPDRVPIFSLFHSSAEVVESYQIHLFHRQAPEDAGKEFDEPMRHVWFKASVQGTRAILYVYVYMYTYIWSSASAMIYSFFATVFHVFATVDSPPFLFSMKIAKSRKIVFGSCILEFDEIKI